MNSKQRRTVRRYLEKNLYYHIYQNGVDKDREGCYEYDLFPSKSKMYIDFPLSDNDVVVYVKIPSFHILNRDNGTLKGNHTIKFSSSQNMLALSSIEALKEVTPFEGAPSFTIEQGSYPQYLLETSSNYVYWFFSDYNNKIVIKKKLVDSSEDKYVSTKMGLEQILDDPNVNNAIKKELAFNIDLFGTKGISGNVDY